MLIYTQFVAAILLVYKATRKLVGGSFSGAMD